MRKKILLFVVIALMLVLMCTGCAKKGMDGKWVKTQYIEADGTVYKGEDAGPAEVYTIEGDRAWYSTSLEVNGKEVGMELAIVENEDGTYDFRLMKDGKPSERVSLLTNAEFKGNTMTATLNDGAQFVFESQK